jgi:hypothetical protein
VDRAGQLAHPGWCDNLIAAGGLRPRDRVAVIVDEPLLEEGSQLAAAVKDAGGDPRLALWIGDRPFRTPPSATEEAAGEADLTYFLLETMIGDEAGARLELSRAARGDGGRQIFLGFVDGRLLRDELSRPSVDLSDQARDLLEQVDGAETIRVTGAGGTDLTLRVGGREWRTDALPLQAGGFANYPGGEIFVAPHRDGADGVLVADLTVPYTVEGLVDAPVRIRFEAGRAVSIEGGRAADMLRRLVEEATGDGDLVAELGIGLNPAVQPRGNALLDEKAAGTAHVALGASRGHGGDVDASIHVDCIFSAPQVWADSRPVRLP